MKRPGSTTSSIACFISGVTVARERGIIGGPPAAARETENGKRKTTPSFRSFLSRFPFPVFRPSKPREPRLEGEFHLASALGRLIDRRDDLQRPAPLGAVHGPRPAPRGLVVVVLPPAPAHPDGTENELAQPARVERLAKLLDRQVVAVLLDHEEARPARGAGSDHGVRVRKSQRDRFLDHD